MASKLSFGLVLGGLTTLSAATIAIAATSTAVPKPEDLWKQIQALEASNAIMAQSHPFQLVEAESAIMAQSHPFQLGSRTVDYYTTDLSNRPVNEAIHKAGKITAVTRYPNGSLMVKVNYDKNKSLTGITAMLKVDGFDAADRNWLMAQYSPTGKVVAYGKVSSCINCHSIVTKQDFNFAPPPTQLLPIPIWKAFFPTQTISPAYAALLKQHPEAVVK